MAADEFEMLVKGENGRLNWSQEFTQSRWTR